MFEAYSVAVTLRINNLVSPQLALLAREFSALETTTLGLIAKLKTVGAESAALRSVASAMRSVEIATERAVRSAAQLQGHLAAVQAAAAAMPPIGVAPGTGGTRIVPGVGVGGGSSNRPGGFHGGNIHIGTGGVGIGGIGMNAGNAFVPLALTAAGIWGGQSLYEAARDYKSAYTRFKTLNLGAEVNKQATEFARGTRVMGVSSEQLMETLRETTGMLGSLESARAVALRIAQHRFRRTHCGDLRAWRDRGHAFARLRAGGGLRRSTRGIGSATSNARRRDAFQARSNRRSRLVGSGGCGTLFRAALDPVSDA